MLGIAATAVVGVLLGSLLWDRGAPVEKSAQEAQAVTPAPVPAKPQDSATPPASSAPSVTPLPSSRQTPDTSQAAAATPPSDKNTPPARAASAPSPADGPVVPSFDVVRVEKDGDSVIAGRAAPGATIELLRNDQVHARGVADASGLFAIVPPPLPRGSHQIVLQSIAPDGTRQRSRENVTVVISGDARPLVALAAPDKPTVLLSNPEPPEAKPAAGPAVAQPVPAPQAPGAQAAVARPEVKILSVDAEEGGRLFVSGLAASGATVRLYLNESFIAPGGAGADGKVSFSIGRGVKPGDYRIRLDDVDPVSGNVKSRAEVGFIVPPVVASAQPSSPAGETGQPTPGQMASSTTPTSQALPTNQTASAEATVVIPDINTAIVSRGDSLWRISRRIYGQGLRYTVIFGANQTQIRNPNKIYPGQVFVLPNGEPVQVQN